MDPSDPGSHGDEQGAKKPDPPEGTGSGEPAAQPADGATPLALVLTEASDLIAMLQVDDEGRLRCRSALSSKPASPHLPELVGLEPAEIFPEESLQRFEERYAEARSNTGAVEYEEQLRVGDGDTMLAVTLTPIFDGDGTCTHLFWAARDVTEERSTAQALRDSEERFTTLFHRASIGIALTDHEGAFLEVNPTLSEMLGRTADALLATSVGELAHPDESEPLERMLGELGSLGTETASRETRLLNDRGEAVWVQADVTAIPRRGGRTPRLLWHVQDLTERRNLEERLEHQALHDPLTGLPNRALLMDRLGQALSRLDRNPSPIAVTLTDIDAFDEINDRLGHQAGDQVLVAVADSLRESIRQADTIARQGADEFVLLFESLDDEEDVAGLARRVAEAVDRPVEVDGSDVTLTACVGVAVSTTSGERPEALLRNAGLALQKAKAKGRGSIEVFEESMRAETVRRLQTEDDLKQAIEEGQFTLFYQPQVSLSTGTIVGAEVLVRWQHPERGLVTPSGFLDLAEESGLIVPLGAWVVEEACRQSDNWREDRRGESFLTMVNLSQRELNEPDYPDTVSKVLADTGVEASSLCLEIAESVLMEESNTAVVALRALKDLGVTICIRDFGAGFSSHAYLKRLPVDMLKLDKAFVSGLGHNEEDSAISSAVINLARAMGLKSIAQGVETADQLAALREMGCDLAVGYFFASPQPAEVMDELLRQDLRW